MEKTIPVTPYYGWGWLYPDEDRIDAPDPFNVALTVEGPPRWEGKIVTVGHIFEGCKIVMTSRHTDWDGVVNVSITTCKDPQADVHGFGGLPFGGELKTRVLKPSLLSKLTYWLS